MTFLNPFVLFGLAAAAIPVILHLLNLRKLRTIEFSSLRFLKELQKTKMRRLRIRQILLLIIRTLLIIALVFAFARPALKGPLAGMIGSRATTTMVLLLDDSPSMMVRNEQGTMFAQIKEAAARIAGLAKDGDQIYVLRASDIRHATTFTPARSIESARGAIAQMQSGQERIPFAEVMAKMKQLLAASSNANREMYLLTDGQATQFQGSHDTSSSFDARTRVFLLRPRIQQLPNVGITGVEVTTQIIAQNKPVELIVHARNFGPSPTHNLTMSVYLAGKPVAQQSLEIPLGGTEEPHVTVIPKQRGILEGYVQTEDDPLEIDNTRYFVVTVPENINVVMVGATAQDIRLPALGLTLAGDSTLTGLFSVRQILETQISTVDFNTIDVAILSGIKDFTPVEGERLAQFVQGGGGLLIFPGNETSVPNYNETLFARLGIPPIRAATGGPDSSGQRNGQESFLSFEKIDFAHPLFSGLFEQPAGKKSKAPSVESPRVWKAIVPQPGAKGHTIISLSNGTGFLTEYAAGRGKVLLCSVEAGLAWSDFPLKGLFAPLLHREAVYLASRNQSTSGAIVGSRVELVARLRSTDPGGAFVLRSPEGVDERVVPRVRTEGSEAIFESSNTDQTGIYELRREGDQRKSSLQAVAVNVDPLESDLRPADENELKAFWKSVGLDADQVREPAQGELIENAVEQSRYGVELWKYLAGFAVILALFEMALGRAPKQEPQVTT